MRIKLVVKSQEKLMLISIRWVGNKVTLFYFWHPVVKKRVKLKKSQQKLMIIDMQRIGDLVTPFFLVPCS